MKKGCNAGPAGFCAVFSKKYEFKSKLQSLKLTELKYYVAKIFSV